MLRRILVPLDGSALAERALAYATVLARAAQGHVILTRVVEADENRVSARREAEAYLDRIAAGLGDPAFTVERVIAFGVPGEAIVRTVDEGHAELVVLSTHGRSGLGRWIYGSVADHVLRHAPIPVVLIPATCERSWPAEEPFRILIPLDGSTLSEQILGPAGELAQLLAADLRLIEVIEPINYALFPEGAIYIPPDPEIDLAEARQYLEAVAVRLRDAGHACSVQAEIGNVAALISRLAQESVSLIAMATHGERGLPRLILGSIATQVLHRATLPLLLIGPAALKPEGSVPSGAATSDRASVPQPA